MEADERHNSFPFRPCLVTGRRLAVRNEALDNISEQFVSLLAFVAVEIVTEYILVQFDRIYLSLRCALFDYC